MTVDEITNTERNDAIHLEKFRFIFNYILGSLKIGLTSFHAKKINKNNSSPEAFLAIVDDL